MKRRCPYCGYPTSTYVCPAHRDLPALDPYAMMRHTYPMPRSTPEREAVPSAREKED